MKLYFECLFMMIHCVSKETLKVNAMCFILFYVFNTEFRKILRCQARAKSTHMPHFERFAKIP